MSIKKKHVTELDKVIGQKLKNLRYQHNLSQNDIAKLLGVSIQQIQKYENGTNRLSLSSFIVLVKALNLNVNQFLDTESFDDMYSNEEANSLARKNLQKINHASSKLSCNALTSLAHFLSEVVSSKTNA